jgi:hypothetical protein
MEYEEEEENRKEYRKNSLKNRKKNRSSIDEDIKIANKSKKMRKYHLEELEKEELDEEWSEYFK